MFRDHRALLEIYSQGIYKSKSSNKAHILLAINKGKRNRIIIIWIEVGRIHEAIYLEKIKFPYLAIVLEQD